MLQLRSHEDMVSKLRSGYGHGEDMVSNYAPATAISEDMATVNGEDIVSNYAPATATEEDMVSNYDPATAKGRIC